jgi:hypothetical protein
MAKLIAEWPRLVEIAARNNEPHRVAFYLYELASEFHGLWNRGNDDTSLRFIQDGNPATFRRRKSPLPAAFPLSFAAVLLSWASLRSRKCADQQRPVRSSRQRTRLRHVSQPARGNAWRMWISMISRVATRLGGPVRLWHRVV